MKITEILENKDQITTETIKNPELPNGVMFVVDPKWAPRRIHDEAAKALNKCGNMDVLLVPAPVWELVEKFEIERESLLRKLEIKVGLNQHYADRIVELEAELHSRPKKKEADFSEPEELIKLIEKTDAREAEERDEEEKAGFSESTYKQELASKAMEEILDREAEVLDKATDSGLGIPEDRNIVDDEDLAARGDTNIGLEGPDGDPDECDR